MSAIADPYYDPALGFDICDEDKDGLTADDKYDALTAEWKRVITARREAAP